MRWKWLLVTTVVLGAGGWYLWKYPTDMKQWIEEKTAKEVSTLEIRFSADEIVQAHKQELLKTEAHALLESKLSYLPYLWMEVKYSNEQDCTEEGIALWGLTDGEMVLDTSSWETTHGYEDCLMAKAEAHDFVLLNTLAKQGGCLTKQSLYENSAVDSLVLDRAMTSCEKKKLILVKGDQIRLHLEKPKLSSRPVTSLNEEFVLAPGKSAQRFARKYSVEQIKKLAQNMAGTHFLVRRTQEVFVPVYTISVQNPDGSLLTTQWNALTGQKMKK